MGGGQRAVMPVIGIAFVVAIAVILAVVISIPIFEISDSITAPAPTVVLTTQTFGIPPFDLPGTILTPISFSAGLAGIGIAAFRYGTFDTQSVARARTIERMQEGYLLADTDDTIIDANSAAADPLGDDSGIVGEPVAEALPGYESQMPADCDTTTLFEATIGPPDEERTVEVSASTLVSNSLVVGTLCVFRDVTVRKRAQQTLQRQRDDLELLNEVVRHDIRNDLQLVVTSAEVLEREGHRRPRWTGDPRHTPRERGECGRRNQDCTGTDTGDDRIRLCSTDVRPRVGPRTGD